jgi:hypothetical protein
MLEQVFLAPRARMLEQVFLAPRARMLEQVFLAPRARVLEHTSTPRRGPSRDVTVPRRKPQVVFAVGLVCSGAALGACAGILGIEEPRALDPDARATLDGPLPDGSDPEGAGDGPPSDGAPDDSFVPSGDGDIGCTGCTVRLLMSGQDGLTHLALGGNSLFWSREGDPMGHTVWRARLPFKTAPSGPESFPIETVTSLAADPMTEVALWTGATSVYMTDMTTSSGRLLDSLGPLSNVSVAVTPDGSVTSYFVASGKGGNAPDAGIYRLAAGAAQLVSTLDVVPTILRVVQDSAGRDYAMMDETGHVQLCTSAGTTAACANQSTAVPCSPACAPPRPLVLAATPGHLLFSASGGLELTWPPFDTTGRYDSGPAPVAAAIGPQLAAWALDNHAVHSAPTLGPPPATTRLTQLPSAVVDLVLYGAAIVVATADGHIYEVDLAP